MSHAPTRPVLKRLRFRVAAAGALAGMLLSACATGPMLGADDPMIRGAVAGSVPAEAGELVPRCEAPLGTLALAETNEPHLPLLRVLIQQSNCFVVLERGRGFATLDTERQLRQGGLTRGSNASSEPTLLASDYTLVVTVNFAEPSGFALTTGLGGLLGRSSNKLDTSLQVGSHGASASLLLLENTSGAQIAAAQGSAKNVTLGAGIGLLGGLAAGVNAYMQTPQGKLVAGALLDAYRRLIAAAQNYTAQRAPEHLGRGGRLRGPQAPEPK
ncbi:MAG: peptidoglycan-binding protein [Casimicrobiaceae bacterium]|nr:peptidoglycan-binding protein [Casimicrobiaceae bacterium]MCX8097650.1 peptidoglycan-binding protein [Casimicrobiaceae bacterium]MDW8311842.1 peptidoglycan-binding protein [Burkholderiales bacterium]